uniref:Uncharacterized protein n=1 Tax=Cacopsylla melanoneura TaxID=428564 RepID=A0A8D8ZC70_9HEMI
MVTLDGRSNNGRLQTLNKRCRSCFFNTKKDPNSQELSSKYAYIVKIVNFYQNHIKLRRKHRRTDTDLNLFWNAFIFKGEILFISASLQTCLCNKCNLFVMKVLALIFKMKI